MLQWINAAIGLLLLAGALPAGAERLDRKQPIKLDADRVMLDERRKVSVFEGAVRFAQGSLLILADRIELTQDRLGHKQCVATGRLASFRQRQEGGAEYIEGYGERIEYDTDSGRVDLLGQARMRREQDDVQGDHITYNSKTEVFKVIALPDAASPGAGRVRVVIMPKGQQEADAESAPPAINQKNEP